MEDDISSMAEARACEISFNSFRERAEWATEITVELFEIDKSTERSNWRSVRFLFSFANCLIFLVSSS